MNDQDPKTGKDFVELATKSGKARVKRVSGSHYIIEFADGNTIPVPVHGNRQLGKGLLHKLKKVFKTAGILLVILFVLWIGSHAIPMP